MPRENRRENWVLQIELRTTACYNVGAEKQSVSFAKVSNAPNAWDISRMTEKWVLKDSWSLVMKLQSQNQSSVIASMVRMVNIKLQHI